MLPAVWSILLELAPWLLLGTAVASALHVFMPAGWLERQLSGYGGVAKAVALGVPLPLCSCGVIPAGIGLKKDGASTGSSIGFLISTPQTGVDSVLVAASFLGWPFALFKVAAAAITGLAGGFLVEATDSERAEPIALPHNAAPRTLRDGLDHGVELLQTIWRWLVFGVLVSAVLTVFVPAGGLADTILGTGAVAVFAVLLLSVPLYVCATASVPIAASLVAAGLPTGAALVFLMAGPATNVATIGAVNRVFGKRVTAIYLGTVVLGSVGLGLAFDAAWGATTVAAVHHHSHAWWAQVSAVVLLGLLGWFAIDDLRSWLRNQTASPLGEDAVVELQVDGMTCGGCAKKLDGHLWGVDGVTGVEVSHQAGRATVRGTATQDRLLEAVRAAGFTPAG